MDSVNSKKALNFDLNDNLLKVSYPNQSSYKNGWRDIKAFLEKNDFEHRQYSGYVSKGVISYPKVNDIIQEMNEKYPWIKECVMEFDVTAVLEEYSLLRFFK